MHLLQIEFKWLKFAGSSSEACGGQLAVLIVSPPVSRGIQMRPCTSGVFASCIRALALGACTHPGLVASPGEQD